MNYCKAVAIGLVNLTDESHTQEYLDEYTANMVRELKVNGWRISMSREQPRHIDGEDKIFVSALTEPLFTVRGPYSNKVRMAKCTLREALQFIVDYKEPT